MRKWFSNLSPDMQAKIVVGFAIAQIMVNTFIVLGVVVFVLRLIL